MSKRSRTAGPAVRRLWGVAVAAVALAAAVGGCGRKAGRPPVLFVYSGAGLRPAVSELVELFQRREGVKVECDYSGSNMILGRLRVSRRGDVFIPGDVRYVEMARREGLVASSVAVAYLVPVILVAKGNPRGIRRLADLLREDVKLGLGDPQACAVGKVAQRIFEKNGFTADQVARRVAFRSLTVNELGLQITAGKLDAAVVWDATAHQYEGRADVVEIPPERNVISTVAVAVLTCSEHPELAVKFQRLAASSEGKGIWARHGFTVEPPGGRQAGDQP